jgi:hypothetical protein
MLRMDGAPGRLEFYAISAVSGQGTDELKWAFAKHLRPAE